MKQELIEEIQDALCHAGYPVERLLGHIESGFVDAPSSSFYWDDDKMFIDTDVFSDYPVEDNVTLMLTLKDMDKEEIIEFLSHLLNSLKGC